MKDASSHSSKTLSIYFYWEIWANYSIYNNRKMEGYTS